MVVAVIPHQNLFKIHGNSFCKKLPDKVFLALLRLLLQLAVLLMIKVSQLVIDQPVHCLTGIPLKFQNLFDSEQNHIPSMDAGHPSGSVAQPQIQNNICVYPPVEGLDDALVEMVSHCQKGLLQDIPLRILKNCLNDRQKVLFKGIFSACNIFFYLILKQIRRIFID